MAERYVSALTGPEMDAALLDMAQHNSEAWAVGTRNGAAVSSSDDTYQNNSKYYANEAEAAAARAEAAVPAGTEGAVLFSQAQSLTDAQKAQARENVGSDVLSINASGITALPYTINNPAITSDMIVVNFSLSGSGKQTDTLTITPADGSLTITGSIYGTVDVAIGLAHSRSSVRSVVKRTLVPNDVNQYIALSDCNNATALLSSINGWASPNNVPAGFARQFGILITVWTYPVAIGTPNGDKSQALIWGNGSVSFRRYSGGTWSDWATK